MDSERCAHCAELTRRIAELERANDSLREEAHHVASANVRAAHQMAQISQARQRELEKQKTELEQALAAARQAAEKRDEFLAMVSHELRTPMNGVLGMLTLARDQGMSPAVRDCIDAASDSARHLLHLIEDILNFSQLRAGRLQLHSELVDPWSLAEDVVRLCLAGYDNSEVSTCLLIGSRVPRSVPLDRVRLTQVLVNLTANALKFTDVGSVELEVDAVETNGHATLHFAVRDSGPGIDTEYLPHLFEAFTQGQRYQTRRKPGTGLGLAISQHLVRLMGGEIKVETQAGHGSEFAFSLPLAMPLAAPGRAEPDTRLICITRCPDVRQVVSHTLSPLGAQIEFTDTLAAANNPLTDVLLLLDPRVARNVDYCSIVHAWDESGGRCVVLANPGGSVPTCTESNGQLLLPIAPHRLLELVRYTPSGPISAERDRPKALTTDPRLAGLRVLVVEDNAVNQKVARGVLERFGCHVTSALDGAIALRMSADRVFDVILMDCQMPGMDGYAAARAIRADVKNPNCQTPIIAVTAHSMPGDRKTCLDAGMDDYVAKPFMPDQLREAIARQIARCRGRAGAPAGQSSGAGTDRS
ncbi:MAG: response regulator [Planctomycetes bacterium]|nr:response regulator [Planctomycetota bacterium]